MTNHSFRFTHALCRRPARSCTQGLRAFDMGAPDPELFDAEHAAYMDALRHAGAMVTVLEPLEDFPDSCFIEDPALCLKGTAIVLRPGAPTRLGEAQALKPVLEGMFPEVRDLPGTGFVDGGDILCSDTEVMVGLSARTDLAGVEALRPLVEDLGYTLRIVETPADILHFKTESSLLDSETILATPKLAATGCFDGYRVIETAPLEHAAANAIRFNDHVFVSAGHPRTVERLDKAGYNVAELPMTQAALLDGGLSCLSLRFSLAGGLT
jgi:dimethylargininase